MTMSGLHRTHALSWAFLLGCSGLAPLAASAHDMKMDMGSGSALGASAAFDAHGRLWLVSARGEHVVLQHAADPGTPLGTPVVVNAKPEAVYATGENRPKIVFGPAGEVYVQWTEKPAAGWVGDVRFARSSDGGKTFAAPITVNHDTALATRGFDSLAVAGNGDVVSAWIDGRDSVAAKAAGKPYAGFALYYTRSTDGGRSFAPERKLMDHSCECCRTTLARLPDGGIATFFRGIYGENIRDHAYAVLPAGSHPAHTQRATFNQWQVAACPDHGPGLAIDAHGVRHAVWYEAKGAPTIWYGQLDPGHAPKHLLRIGGPGASHADVAVHGNTVWLAWNQVDAQGYALMLRRSDDGGVHFAAPRNIATSTRAAGSPQLLLRGAHAYAAWNTADGFRLIDTEAH